MRKLGGEWTDKREQRNERLTWEAPDVNAFVVVLRAWSVGLKLGTLLSQCDSLTGVMGGESQLRAACLFGSTYEREFM